MFERKSSCERVTIHRNNEAYVVIHEELLGKQIVTVAVCSLRCALLKYGMQKTAEYDGCYQARYS